MLIDLGAPAKAADGGIAVGQGQLAAIFHHHVVVKFVAQVLPQLDRLAVKGDALFGEIVERYTAVLRAVLPLPR